MRQLIAGNWKMHGFLGDLRTLVEPVAAQAETLACDLMLCPPATLLVSVAQAVRTTAIAVGAQDCHAQECGPHTGDLSASMLRDAGATATILGHSERRAEHGETDALVAAKVRAAMAAGLQPIVCVGETQAQRAAGREQAVVGVQLANSLPDGFAGVVSYEPVWAIGLGRTPSEREVASMHAFIRSELVRRFGAAGAVVRILYGGSVKPGNAGALLAIEEVGGALVGGASLDAAAFLAIAQAARAS
jgi:triosephosphate isomerase